MKSYTTYLSIMGRTVAPARERGLKSSRISKIPTAYVVAPARERGLKLIHLMQQNRKERVAPARERGLKSLSHVGEALAIWCRSREGAWIEIEVQRYNEGGCVVAPARERGLKWQIITLVKALLRRSREGAWIEIPQRLTHLSYTRSLPRGSVD